jgi:hypothetical protein
VLTSSVLAAVGLGVLSGAPAGAEGSTDLAATCQSDGTYLVTFTFSNFVLDSTITGGATDLSGAYVGTIPMAPTFLAASGAVASGSTTIPGTTAGVLQSQIQLTSVNGGSGGSMSISLAGDCVASPAVDPAATDAPASDPGISVAGTSAARAIVAVPRTAG